MFLVCLIFIVLSTWWTIKGRLSRHSWNATYSMIPLETISLSPKCQSKRNPPIFHSQWRLRSVTRTFFHGLDYASHWRFRIILKRVRPDSRVLEMPEIRYSKRSRYLRVRVILCRVLVRTYEYVRAGQISHGIKALQEIVSEFTVILVLVYN